MSYPSRQEAAVVLGPIVCAGLALFACSGQQAARPTGSGGEVTAGGAVTTGGTVAESGGAATGGVVGSGGIAASGGVTTPAGTGGSGSGGVATRDGGSGGTPGLAGGATGTGGGALAAGGASGGVTAGGRPGSGGAGTGGTSGGGAGGRSTGAGGAGPGDGAAGGATGSGGASTGGATGACAGSASNQHPFGCNFAWGIANPGGSLAGYSYLQLVSYWVDSTISKTGTYTSCGACTWLKNSVASTNLVPVYYAYIIGYLGHANGIVDGNQSGSKKLTTDGAALIKANYQAIVDAYAWYAKQTAQAWPSKPLVWLLEGDFVQYTNSGQTSPLSYTELGQLAADITCAIKSNMPNAVVAIDHSSWNADDVTKSYWAAMKSVGYDMVWTTGVGDNNGFIASGTTASSYNGATSTYAYLHSTTGRTILVDTSAGASAAGDSWSTTTVANLNARISEGVIAANITGTPPNGLSGNLSKLVGLSAIPSCP